MIIPSELHALVVEDNDFARALAVESLQQLGLKSVFDAADAISGLVIARREKIDFILLDWYMSEINGAGFVRLVRQGFAGCAPDIPIIICTAYATRENTVRIRELGLREILIKPIDTKRMGIAVSMVISSILSLAKANETMNVEPDQSEQFLL